MVIKVLNGPNLNFLGIREPGIYGKQTYADLVRAIRTECKKRGIRVSVVQTNDEGKLVTEIQKCYGKVDGIVINPAAYTHTSVAILDAVKAVGIPTVEVHLSDLSKREAFRQVSYIRQAVDLTVTGKGIDGYLEAIAYLDETYGKGKIR